MAEITVRILGEADWRLYRQVRLAALKDAPRAFAARWEDETSHADDVWRERMTRAHRFVAEREEEPVGVVSLGSHSKDPEGGEGFDLWASPSARRGRIASQLVSAAARRAARDGRRLLYFWAGSDNAAAVGFASIFGFRPTDERRPMRIAEGASGETTDEVAMVLSLSPDPTATTRPYPTTIG